MSRRPMTATLALAVTLALAPAARAEDDAKTLAVKLTAAGAALFDARDARGLAQTYDDDARLVVYTRDESGLKTDVRVGRAEVEAYYADHFKNEQAPHARNTIDHARYLGKDMIEFSGVFEPNTEAADPFKLPFTQIRVRSGNSWKIVSMQVFITFK